MAAAYKSSTRRRRIRDVGMKQAASKVHWSQRNALYRQVYKSLPSFTASTSYQLVVSDTDSKTWPALESTALQPPPRVKMPPSVNYVRPTRPEDWEPYRGIIEELYKTQKLKDVMDTMERVYFFKATTRQYKTKIKEWGLDDKYIKTNEYIGILKEKRRLERDDPGRSYEFYLRGKHVEASSILRFESRATKRGLIQAGESLADRESLGSELQYFPSDEAYAEEGEYDDYYGYDAGQSQYSSYGYS
ncbi:hypothetical protein MGG_06790 [Pyricularia oryzae 70-15]|uniref:Clr5 domain-containing protein n=1 Tax=Pyricularia oryzae (strain 70-15 / ATCC MYA-4617 / FGSC 8958) TaxID=242507 RepID=G4MM12_PYRO7|nr:uncharacterized protein MGG_06790 [Pyricularia oryzae 70-15]EHA56897.1 hypothetical protein MGG_06790 [Pyricularia oryzae 70-15]KAI7912215.1 hypothetical protein M9X92_010142 [Pyricularia oryzae]